MQLSFLRFCAQCHVTAIHWALQATPCKPSFWRFHETLYMFPLRGGCTQPACKTLPEWAAYIGKHDLSV